MKPTFKTLGVDDDRVLQALIVEHAESLEAGLTVLSERVLMGETTIDLVAQDSDGSLVLIAAGLVADDAMVLRMLEAFAWCAEHPGALARLYAATPADVLPPSRVIFVGRRLSDSFLRKVRYLRIPAVECLEFRYLEVNGVDGLYFNPVETWHLGPAASRTAASPPVPSPRAPVAAVRPKLRASAEVPTPRPVLADPPMPEPIEFVDSLEPPAAAVSLAEAPGPAEPAASAIPALATPPPNRATETHPSDLLSGLRLPDNLSSQWQRILNRAATAPDPAKIRAVREYLQSEFPNCVLYDFYEHQHAVQMFHLQSSHGEVVHSASVSDDFLERHAERDIRPFLDKHRLAGALRDAGSRSVLITPAGLQATKA